jgi:hypothetical protein
MMYTLKTLVLDFNTRSFIESTPHKVVSLQPNLVFFTQSCIRHYQIINMIRRVNTLALIFCVKLVRPELYEPYEIEN